jgi:hypothetical protein
LAPGIWIVALLESPIKLIVFVISKLGQFLAMDSEYLVSELLRHVLDHLLHTTLLEGTLVEAYSVQPFES